MSSIHNERALSVILYSKIAQKEFLKNSLKTLIDGIFLQLAISFGQAVSSCFLQLNKNCLESFDSPYIYIYIYLC